LHQHHREQQYQHGFTTTSPDEGEAMTPANHTLIVYYSRSGTTARVGHALAQRLGTDEVVIQDMRAQGHVSVGRALLDRLFNTLPPIAPIAVPLESYDLVVLGTPVWGGRAAAPVRRFLNDYAPRLPAVAFFCTMGGSGAESTFADMQARLGKPPRASCSFEAKALDNGSYMGALDHFATQLTGDAHSPFSSQPGAHSIPMHH
jgi:flavodoxin